MRILAAVVAVLAAYVVAGTLGALVPVNAAWRPPARGVTIWVEDNGIHTDLVLPKRAVGVDWHRLFPGSDLADPRYAAFDHIAVGWGERGFYIGTPTWWDLRPWVVARAALGSDETVLHVEHVARPRTGESVRAIVLRPEEYRRLAAAIRASMGAGRVERGYFAYDAFYAARGRYDAVRTCNDWTGATLAAAGVQVGWWTPFASGVMRWF